MDYLLQVFKGVANERRLKILELLMKNGELSLQEIAKESKMPLATCSRNLKILEKVYLVKRKIQNAEAYYSLNKPQNHLYNMLIFELIKRRQEKKKG